MLAFTALDLMSDSRLLETAKADFAATAELSTGALARLQEKVPHHHEAAHAHGAGGCGCA